MFYFLILCWASQYQLTRVSDSLQHQLLQLSNSPGAAGCILLGLALLRRHYWPYLDCPASLVVLLPDSGHSYPPVSRSDKSVSAEGRLKIQRGCQNVGRRGGRSAHRFVRDGNLI